MISPAKVAETKLTAWSAEMVTAHVIAAHVTLNVELVDIVLDERPIGTQQPFCLMVAVAIDITIDTYAGFPMPSHDPTLCGCSEGSVVHILLPLVIIRVLNVAAATATCRTDHHQH